MHLPVPGVELVPVGHHSRLAVVEERREVDPVVPVLREVPNLAVRQHGLQRKKIHFDTQLGVPNHQLILLSNMLWKLHLEPCEHELLGREV